MFRTTGNKGFHMEFENGVTISVQFGFGNYCDNKYKMELLETRKDLESENAEIAIWKGNGWITKEYKGDDLVIGNLTTEQVLEAMNWAKNYKK